MNNRFVWGHNARGIPKSEEHNRKNALAHIGLKLSAEAIEKIRLKAIGRRCTEETKVKMRQSKAEFLNTPVGKKQLLRWMKIGQEATRTPEARLKKSLTLKGHKVGPIRYGWHHSDGTKQFLSSQKRNYYLSGGISPTLGRKRPEYEKEQLREIALSMWKDPKFVEKVVLGWNREPNQAELRLISILNGIFPQFKYNGDGKMQSRIGLNFDGLIPDFIDLSSKRVIELFGDFWHEAKDEVDKVSRYTGLGWSCLVIWEHELREEKVLIGKVNSWFKGGDKNG